MKDLFSASLDRRALLRGSAQAGMGLALGGILAGCGGDGNTIGNGGGNGGGTGLTEAQALNFALNLEYLEAEYYLIGTGRKNANDDTDGFGPGALDGRAVEGGLGAYEALANEIAEDERKHVVFLRSALGSAAVIRPRISLQAAFAAAAEAAGLGTGFDVFANATNFLIGAFAFEDVGVTAYAGAAPAIKTPAFLTAAAGILGVEAYHAAAIRGEILRIGGDAVTAANAISRLRGRASANNTGLGFNDPAGKDETVDKGGYNLVPTDANSVSFARTGAEVTRIVTLGGANSKGGFFPDGFVLSR